MGILNRKSGFARNAAANLFAYTFIAVVSFMLSPFVVRHLGADGYGVWSLAAGLVGYLSLLDFGIRQAVNRFVAHHRAVGEHDRSSDVVSVAARLFAMISVAVLVLASALAYLAPLIFNIPADYQHVARVIIILGGMTVSFALLGGVFGGVVSGVERFDIQCILEVTVTSIRALGTIIVLSLGYKLIALSAVHVVASLISLVAYATIARRVYTQLKFSLTIPMWNDARRLLKFGASAFAIFVFSKIAFQTDSLVIAYFLPIESVAYYAIASNLIFQAFGIGTTFSHLLTPRVSSLASQGRSEAPQQVLLVAKFSTLFIAPVSVTLLLRGETFIGLWMGLEYAQVSGQVLAILSLVLWQHALRSAVISALTGLGRQKILVPGLLLEASVNLLLSIMLIKPFGIAGVAIATLLPSVAITFIVFPICMRRTMQISQLLLLHQAIVLPSLACVIFAIATGMIELFVPTPSLGIFLLQVVILLPLVALGAWKLALSADEKRRIVELLSGALARRGEN